MTPPAASEVVAWACAETHYPESPCDRVSLLGPRYLCGGLHGKTRPLTWADTQPAPAVEALTEMLLEKHRRYHTAVGCPGMAECYVCQAEDAAFRQRQQGEAT